MTTLKSLYIQQNLLCRVLLCRVSLQANNPPSLRCCCFARQIEFGLIVGFSVQIDFGDLLQRCGSEWTGISSYSVATEMLRENIFTFHDQAY